MAWLPTTDQLCTLDALATLELRGGEQVVDAAAGDEGLGDVLGGEGDGAEGEAGDVEDGDGDEGLGGGELAAEPGGVRGEGGEGHEDGGGEGDGGVERGRARRGAQLGRLARADGGEGLGEGELPGKVVDEGQGRSDLGHEARALVGDEHRPPADRADPAAQPSLRQRGEEEHREERERGGADAGPEDDEGGGKADGGGEEGLAENIGEMNWKILEGWIRKYYRNGSDNIEKNIERMDQKI